ncbi:MAG: hypothetical protein JWO38_622 [Gemmataceae bacterium]|nr:hypothetical protein [Gemmataceae bacterium]
MRTALPASALIAALVSVAVLPAQPPQDKAAPKGEYVKKATRAETVRATLAAHGLPNLGGKWYYAGPFDNTDRAGFDYPYPPEKAVDLKAVYPGKGGEKVGWKEYKDFRPGEILNLATLFPDDRNWAVVYLYHEFESDREFRLPLSLGSDDTCSVFFNGKRILHEDHERAAAPDQYRVELAVKPGKNQLLVKIGQYGGGWEVYAAPDLPDVVPAMVRKQADRDFPPGTVVQSAAAAPAGNEAVHYKLVTIPQPADCVLEVGGLGFRPDGSLLACTRRGEVWLIQNPTADAPAEIKFSRYASGLHEALGLFVDSQNVVYVVQRPELTKLVDKDGDGVADEFVTVCDKWGVSGDYHEFAFGPARDRDGNFFITLNVGFGGGHQAKAPWRGWCVKVSPDGKMEPWAYGLRSPNGINFAPDGELFYCDNQGEWAATNKMHHLKRGKFYGHQAGLRWVKDSPFAGKVPDKVASGMRYDGEKGPGANAPGGYPDLDPPCIWFPYGRMGNSTSEPIWDTTGGKFGPFAGQCFVGDQGTSFVSRVALEKVNGVYQGACFPFRRGFQCGVNRLVFAPDGSLFAGQTNRGWGSIGGKPYGLQRLVYTGVMPFEIHHVTLTPTGFDLTFTKPLDPKTMTGVGKAFVGSYTYLYYSNYGCPEIDRRAEKVVATDLSADGMTLSLTVPGLRKGRVYEIRLDGAKTPDGEKLLHEEAYYTLNELAK